MLNDKVTQLWHRVDPCVMYDPSRCRDCMTVVGLEDEASPTALTLRSPYNQTLFSTTLTSLFLEAM